MILHPQTHPLELLNRPPQTIDAAGPTEILACAKIGFFCSAQCPGGIILKTFDAITAMRNQRRVLIGGFHSPMERECLATLLRGRQPVIWVPARSIVGMTLKPTLQPAFADGRLLILSPFAPDRKRITAHLAQSRNRFVATLADQAFIPPRRPQLPHPRPRPRPPCRRHPPPHHHGPRQRPPRSPRGPASKSFGITFVPFDKLPVMAIPPEEFRQKLFEIVNVHYAQKVTPLLLSKLG